MDWQAETIEALGLKKDKEAPSEKEKVKEEPSKEEEKPTEEEFEGVDSEEEIPKGQESKYGL